MNKETLNNRKGKFTSLSFRNGNKRQSYCAQILKVSEKTVRFRDINSGEILLRNLSSIEE